MKRLFIIVALAFGLVGCLPPAKAADTSVLCSLGADSSAVKSLNLNKDQMDTLLKSCNSGVDSAAKLAVSAATTKNEKVTVESEPAKTASVAKEQAEKAAPADDGFGKRFTDGINAVVNSIAGAITSTARQLNVTVNEFIKSPAGILVILFIFAKYFGYTVFKFVTTLFFWYFITRLYIWCTRRCMDYTATFEDRKFLWGMFTYKKKVDSTYTTFDAMGESAGMIFIVSTICYAIFTIIVMCNII